jgi:DNA-binding MarR family transcriptional regulator
MDEIRFRMCGATVYEISRLEGDKGNISHRLRPLESKGWIVIDRPSSGRAAYLALRPEGLEKAAEI